MPLYVNRFTRRRLVDPSCRAIREPAGGADDDHFGETRPPARILEIAEPTDPAEIQALRDFTSPCTFCVPGARES